LKDYIYIPLGGSRKGDKRTLFNLFTTFLLGGIWHGAGWNFVCWGMLHGFSVACCHWWGKHKKPMHWILSCAVTVIVVIIGWVFFRANSLSDAFVLLSKIINWQPASSPGGLFKEARYMCIYSAVIVAFAPNSQKIINDIAEGKRIWLWGLWLGILCPLVILCLVARELPASPFLYFQF
jgi:D-alanyl-lipoteichoic acid acyltransferase DltB (MBOAT superfamily)